jgi:hypothetical protein
MQVMGSAWGKRMVSGPSDGTLLMSSMLRHQYAGRTHFRYSGIFPKQAPTPTLTSTDAAIMAAEALIKALNNPAFSPHVEKLRDTAETALQQLSKAYEMNQELASPRVEEAPRGAPSPRVPTAIHACEHPAQ